MVTLYRVSLLLGCVAHIKIHILPKITGVDSLENHSASKKTISHQSIFRLAQSRCYALLIGGLFWVCIGVTGKKFLACNGQRLPITKIKFCQPQRYRK